MLLTRSRTRSHSTHKGNVKKTISVLKGKCTENVRQKKENIFHHQEIKFLLDSHFIFVSDQFLVKIIQNIYYVYMYV
jgi:hypothetical protein